MAVSALRPDDLRREPVLPPGFSLVTLRESADAFAHACTIAAGAGAAEGRALDALIARVASPGGTTRAGLDASQDAVTQAGRAGIDAAVDRARELGSEQPS